jgi:hypothetical protein
LLFNKGHPHKVSPETECGGQERRICPSVDVCLANGVKEEGNCKEKKKKMENGR